MSSTNIDNNNNTQAQLQSLSQTYQTIQQDLSTTIQTRQKLSSQQSENQGVHKDFAKLKDDEIVYKLMGPVLVKQEHGEAKGVVEGRLGWIGGELKRTEDRIAELQAKSEETKLEIMQIQQAQQQDQAQAGQAQAGAMAA